MNSFAVTAAPERSDYLRAQYLDMRPRPTFKAVGIILLVVSIPPMVVGIFLLSLEHRLFMAYLFMIAFFAFYVHPRRKVGSDFKNDKSLHVPSQYEFNQEGMHISNEIGETFLTWRELVKWKENKSLFLLYRPARKMIVLPKRFFASEQDCQDFRQLLISNVKEER